ncbi:DUF4270 family protein [Chryseolinea lacunae]|uniref:DUF4270 family protein n=1 Tax=Chryseolinea lacunae TaxID=2801331 RepID=A0ABS1KQN3_9BACT|nr:DUF4270 family protein [Chryseolinea lacunae]MBL0741508.1 DUF4270 family protein [Chryseolinea lacunae]
MNLWANRVGQLAVLAVALFFFSCKEDISSLGYRNPNSKYKVAYVEIPVTSSVILLDSIRTSNFYFGGETNRFMVGSYHDNVFGDVTASTFAQFFTNTLNKIGPTAEFDSVHLRLGFDFYTYGSATQSLQNFSVYELDEEMKDTLVTSYFNRTDIPATTLLGSKSFGVNVTDFNNYLTTPPTSAVYQTIPINAEFGKRIFDVAVRYRDAANKADSLYIHYDEFTKLFKGIAVKATGDKIIGFNPTSPESRIVVWYHEGDKDSLTFSLSFSSLSYLKNFNQIKGNRSGSEVNDVNQYWTEYLQDGSNRYVQQGTGLMTRLDLSKFYEFADTVPNVIINSAELIVENVQTSDLAPPPALSLRMLLSNNHLNYYSTTNPQDVADAALYRGFARIDYSGSSSVPVVDHDSAFYASGDRTSVLPYNSTAKTYNGIITLFCQQMAVKDARKTPFKYFALYPTLSPAAPSSKAVNRAVFPKSGIKLKVFYTKPTTAAN